MPMLADLKLHTCTVIEMNGNANDKLSPNIQPFWSERVTVTKGVELSEGSIQEVHKSIFREIA